MMKRQKSNILISILLFLFPVLSWAADNAQNFFSNNTAMNTHQDTSISALEQVFGTVGNILHGSSGEMLGHIFYKLNQGFCIVVAAWLIISFMMVTFRSAQEGSFLQANKQVAMLCLRVAVACACLLPLVPSSAQNSTDSSNVQAPYTQTGYSFIQLALMKVVVWGVGFANVSWDYALDFMKNGGGFWHPPAGAVNAKGLNIDKNAMDSVLGSTAEGNVGGFGRIIFVNAACMYNYATVQGKTVFVTQNPKDYAIDFPGAAGEDACGSVSWDVNNVCSNKQNNGASCSAAQSAVSGMVADLLPVAQQYICSINPGKGGCSQSPAYNNPFYGQQFFAAFLDYMQQISMVVNLSSSEYKDSTAFIDRAKQMGWAAAGSYYWDISQVAEHIKNLSDISTYVPKPTQGSDVGFNPTAAQEQATTLIKQAQTRLDAYRHSNADVDLDNALPPFPSDKAGALSAFSNSITAIWNPLGKMFALFKSTNTSDQPTDPMIFLRGIGMTAVTTAMEMYLAPAVVSLIASALAGISARVHPLGMGVGYTGAAAVTNVSSWIQMVLAPLAGMLLLVGLILAVYVPMYPFIIFLFGIIGWIIAVIEAMIAMPLACWGLIHPDGHDFWGKAEPAMMLLLGIFLRPVLMIIGLLAGMILSYVSFWLLIHGFVDFLSDLWQQTPRSGSSTQSVLAAAATFSHTMPPLGRTIVDLLTLVVFAGLVYVITTRCFTLIFVLPDNILRWVGGPQQSSDAQQMAQQMQQIASGGGDVGGKTMQGAVDRTHDGAKGVTNWAQRRHQEAEKAEADKGNPETHSTTVKTGGGKGGSEGTSGGGAGGSGGGAA